MLVHGTGSLSRRRVAVQELLDASEEGSQAFLRASEPIDGVLSQGRRVVYVGQREAAVVCAAAEQAPVVLVSDAATTCAVVCLVSKAAGVAAMAHLDRPDCAEEAMVVLMRAMGTHAAAMGGSAASGVSAPGSPSAPVLLPDLRLLVCGAHQAGSPDCREMVTGVVMGFAACLAELDQLHGPHAERDPTWWMRCDAGALAAALRPAVELLCVLRANEGPDGRPRSYGLALDLQTGAACPPPRKCNLLPRGPWILDRHAALWMSLLGLESEPESPNTIVPGLLLVYQSSQGYLPPPHVTGPYPPKLVRMASQLMEMDAHEILLCSSTSPEHEPEGYVDDVRACMRHILRRSEAGHGADGLARRSSGAEAAADDAAMDGVGETGSREPWGGRSTSHRDIPDSSWTDGRYQGVAGQLLAASFTSAAPVTMTARLESPRQSIGPGESSHEAPLSRSVSRTAEVSRHDSNTPSMMGPAVMDSCQSEGAAGMRGASGRGQWDGVAPLAAPFGCQSPVSGGMDVD